MLKTDHLIGLPFRYGRRDCYALCRDFYRDNFGLELPNYARPENWWDKGGNFYMDMYRDEGFRPLDCHPSEYRPGDAILMAVRSPVANHAGILLENGKILHHLWGRRSVAEDYRGLTRNSTVAVLRHRDIDLKLQTSTIDLMEILPDAVRSKITALIARGDGREGESGTDPAQR